MVSYRRNKPRNPDDVFFLTIVTRDRTPWIAENSLYGLLISEMKRLSNVMNSRFKAWVILPEHMHWLLAPGNKDYSDVVGVFKRGVGAELKRVGAIRRGTRLWQDRFWEETIRDEAHYGRCIEYMHWNPVKHGLAVSAREWPYSSFASYVKKGIYPEDWGVVSEIEIAGSEWD